MKTEFIPMEFDSTNPDHVLLLQNALTFLGCKIDEVELTIMTIGYTTKEAIHDYSKKRCLQGSCELDNKLLEALNEEMSKFYHIKGVVRNKQKMPLKGFVLELHRQKIRNKVYESTKLGATTTMSDGRYIYCISIYQLKRGRLHKRHN